MLVANSGRHDELAPESDFGWGGRLSVRTAAFLHVMEADANTGNVAGGLRWASQTDDRIHLAREATRAIRKWDLDFAVTGTGFKVVEDEKGLCIYIHVVAAETLVAMPL